MTERRTRSLTLATDPVARLREIHELDNPSTANPPTSANPLNGSNPAAQLPSTAAAVELGNAATSPPGQPDAQERDNVAALQQSNARTQERALGTAHKRGSGATGVRRSEETQQFDNPVRDAMRQMLCAPYSDDLSKGPATATTIRIPTEIWERLDMAARLQDMTKQDIIADALVKHLVKIGRGEG